MSAGKYPISSGEKKTVNGYDLPGSISNWVFSTWKLLLVMLIEEIDKADTDFQDDMLDVLDQMEFDII